MRTLRSLLTLALLAAPAGAAAEVRHVVVPRDTMWDLAEHYYKDHFQWRRIAQANPAPKVHDPHWIYPGQILVIPDAQAQPEASPAGPSVSKAPPVAVVAPPRPVAVAPEAPASPPEPIAPKPSGFKPVDSTSEGLSSRIPIGLVAQPPSQVRMKALPDWTPDGIVTGLEGHEAMAAEGDSIDVRMDLRGAAVGQRYAVYRRSGPSEEDVDKDADYVVRIGTLKLQRPLGKSDFRAVILKSGDSLQIGDLVERGE